MSFVSCDEAYCNLHDRFLVLKHQFKFRAVGSSTQAFRGGGKVRGARCEVVKCEVPVRGINARRWVICEAGMCEAHRTTGAAGVVVGCEPLKRN